MGSTARAYYGELGGIEPTPLDRHRGFLAWSAAVRRRGNLVTRFPKGPNKGKLAERYRDKQGTFRYALPPMDVRAAEQAVLKYEARQIRAGRSSASAALSVLLTPSTPIEDRVRVAVNRRVRESTLPVKPAPIVLDDRQPSKVVAEAYDTASDALAELRKDVTGLPRKALSELLGIPEWVIPIAAIGTGLILLSGLYDRVRE